MHRALTAYDLQSAAVERSASLQPSSIARSLSDKSLVSISTAAVDGDAGRLAQGGAAATSSRVAQLHDGTLVYYADTAERSPFSVVLEDFRQTGGASRVCHVGKSTRAKDIAELVQSEEGTPSTPRLFLDGYELPPDALVCRIARPGSVVLLVPQLTELVSFFVAKVTRPASQLVVDGDMTVGLVKSKLTSQLAGYGAETLPLPAPGTEDVRSIVNYRGQALADTTALRECGVTSATQLHVMLRDSSQLPELPSSAGSRLLGDHLLRMVRAVGAGLDAGRQPQLIEDGLGGAYFLKDERDRTVGVFKPIDEEPYAPANPKGLAGGVEAMGTLSQAKAGVSVGRAAQRECAAYLLDHGGWAGVPHTAMLWVLHTAASDNAGTQLKVELKSGSFQRFVPHMCTAEEHGPSRFALRTTQRIAAFDIRVCNSDRHTGNLLVQRAGDRRREAEIAAELAEADEAGDLDAEEDMGVGGVQSELLRGAAPMANAKREADTAEGRGSVDAELGDESALTLVPIDHGFILPHYRMLGELNYEWAGWPQAREPLDEETKAYIAGLDSHADAAMLRIASSLPEESLLSLHLGTMLLQEGVAHDLSLAEIAQLAMREGRLPSALERAVEYAEGAAEQEARWLHLLPGPLMGTSLPSSGTATPAAGHSVPQSPAHLASEAAAAMAHSLSDTSLGTSVESLPAVPPWRPPPSAFAKPRPAVVTLGASTATSAAAVPKADRSHSPPSPHAIGAAAPRANASDGGAAPLAPPPHQPQPAFATPPSPLSPVESPLQRPAEGMAAADDRRVWEEAFLEAARRFLRSEMARLKRSASQDAASPPAGAAAASHEAREQQQQGHADDHPLPFSFDAAPRMVLRPSPVSAAPGHASPVDEGRPRTGEVPRSPASPPGAPASALYSPPAPLLMTGFSSSTCEPMPTMVGSPGGFSPKGSHAAFGPLLLPQLPPSAVSAAQASRAEAPRTVPAAIGAVRGPTAAWPRQLCSAGLGESWADMVEEEEQEGLAGRWAPGVRLSRTSASANVDTSPHVSRTPSLPSAITIAVEHAASEEAAAKAHQLQMTHAHQLEAERLRGPDNERHSPPDVRANPSLDSTFGSAGAPAAAPAAGSRDASPLRRTVGRAMAHDGGATASPAGLCEDRSPSGVRDALERARIAAA